MNYQIDYEIERYEVHLYTPYGRDGGNVWFYTEEDAVKYAAEYVRTYPDWSAKILRVEKAIVLVLD